MTFRILLSLETGEVVRHATSPDFQSYEEAADYIEQENLESQHPECYVFVEEVVAHKNFWL